MHAFKSVLVHTILSDSRTYREAVSTACTLNRRPVIEIALSNLYWVEKFGLCHCQSKTIVNSFDNLVYVKRYVCVPATAAPQLAS